MPMFRKKSEVIVAVQFTGNDEEIKNFCLDARDPEDIKPNLIIPTLEGDMLVSLNDWVIKDNMGEFYTCKPDLFELTYEAI